MRNGKKDGIRERELYVCRNKSRKIAAIFWSISPARI
jgi:hypothetical protein